MDAQEAKWCADFKELIRRLVAEGFSYEITLEQNLKPESVKIVVVESAEEMAEDEADRFADEPEQRYLD